MIHLGFSGKIVSTIMSCIKSVSYAVLLNGEPVGHVKPDYDAQTWTRAWRSIRQFLKNKDTTHHGHGN